MACKLLKRKQVSGKLLKLNGFNPKMSAAKMAAGILYL
jgi:hypothetical protein